MVKRKPIKQVPPSGPSTGFPDGLRTALTKRRKDELVDVLIGLAHEDRGIRRQLTARFDVTAAPPELIAATRRAIADATEFDPREINHNFSFDYQAYDEVKRNLSRLIALGQLRPVMELALELMRDGSYQVEMSDEGLMTEEIEGCLQIVIAALEKCDLQRDEVITWCDAMLEHDRVGFIATKELKNLRSQLEASNLR